jgi:hypothetical protein
MRLAKITIAITAVAVLTAFAILAINSGVAAKNIDFNVPKLQSTEAKLKNVNLQYEKLSSQLNQQSSTDKKKIDDLNAQKQQLEKQREELQKQVQAKADERERLRIAAANAVNTVTATSTASAASLLPAGNHQDWMAAAGISPNDYGYVDYIVSHESGWRITAQNPSGAYGLCQALPGGKMAVAGADWATNPVTQLRWCAVYAASAHGGGWYNNYIYWTQNRWW